MISAALTTSLGAASSTEARCTRELPKRNHFQIQNVIVPMVLYRTPKGGYKPWDLE